jgi:predicted flap endonuclease-1-like 5' DNA nuclease
MRLDYAYYGLAAVSFAATAAIYLTSPPQSASLYSLITGIVGFAAIGCGFLWRPKNSQPTVIIQESTTATVSTKEAAVQSQPESAQTATIKALKVEVQPAPLEASTTIDIQNPVVTSQGETRQLSTVVAPEPVVEAPATEGPPSPVATAASPSELTQIRGINEKRATKMKTIGIETIDALAAASAEDLAAKLELSTKIVKMWIGSAKKMKK